MAIFLEHLASALDKVLELSAPTTNRDKPQSRFHKFFPPELLDADLEPCTRCGYNNDDHDKLWDDRIEYTSEFSRPDGNSYIRCTECCDLDIFHHSDAEMCVCDHCRAAMYDDETICEDGLVLCPFCANEVLDAPTKALYAQEIADAIALIESRTGSVHK
jgi:hypothetical protein